MTLNLTMAHLIGFLLGAAAATTFFKGWQLIRMIAWIGVWQLTTPARGLVEGSLMLGGGFWIVEYLYRYAQKITGARES